MYYYNAKFERHAVNNLLDLSGLEANPDWQIPHPPHRNSPPPPAPIQDHHSLTRKLKEYIQPNSTKDLYEGLFPPRQLTHTKYKKDVANSGKVRMALKKTEMKINPFEQQTSTPQNFILMHYSKILKESSRRKNQIKESLKKNTNLKSQITKRIQTEQSGSLSKPRTKECQLKKDYSYLFTKARVLRKRTSSDILRPPTLAISGLNISTLSPFKQSQISPSTITIADQSTKKHQESSATKIRSLTQNTQYWQFKIMRNGVKRQNSVFQRIHQKQHTKQLWQLIDNEINHRALRLYELNQLQQSVRTPQKSLIQSIKTNQINHNYSETQHLLQGVFPE